MTTIIVSMDVFMLLFLTIGGVVYSQEIVSVCKSGNSREDYILREGVAENHIAWGSYEDKISSTG